MIPDMQAPAPDSLRAVLRRVYAGPEYVWEPETAPFRVLRDWYGALQEWLAAFETSHPVAYYVLLGVSIALLVAILSHFGVLIWRALRVRPVASAGTEHRTPRPRDAAWYRHEARRLAGAGHHVEALAHHFTALVLELDRQRALTFHPSKTPAEYVAEARLDDPGRGVFRELVGRLYSHVFGGARCSADDVVWFERRIGEVTASGATS